MAKRTTKGKPTFQRVLLGDRALAEQLQSALAAEERPERYTHGFHTYPASLHPDAARDLIALFGGDSLLDPFCGGGTVLVEGRAAGLVTFGRDLSPTAIRVSRARTATPSDEVLTKMRSAARKLTEIARTADEIPPEHIGGPLQQWYARYVACELWAIRSRLGDLEEPVRGLLAAVFSSVLIKVSWRESDTRAQRKKHHRPEGTTAILFHKKTRELARKMIELREALPEGTPESNVAFGDARDTTVPQKVDLVLTSPPYPATYDYLPMQHLRNIWMQDEPTNRNEVGSRWKWREAPRKAVSGWRKDTDKWTARAASVMNPGAHLVVVIGDGLTPQGLIDTSEPTSSAAIKAGLVPVARASLERPDHARGTTRWEHVFAFRKPDSE